MSDFYKLWAAASAVDTLCIIKGKAGVAVGNGEVGFCSCWLLCCLVFFALLVGWLIDWFVGLLVDWLIG